MFTLWDAVAIPSGSFRPQGEIFLNFIPLDDFERLAIEEFKLAAQMDVLAAKRTLEAKGIMAGFSKSDMQKMAGQFKKLWLARNKPSRLKDNLNLFK